VLLNKEADKSLTHAPLNVFIKTIGIRCPRDCWFRS